MRQRPIPIGWLRRDPRHYRFALPNAVWEYKHEPVEFVIFSCLCYYIRPIQEAVDYYYEQQLRQLEMEAERQRAQARLSRLCAAQEPLPAAGWPIA